MRLLALTMSLALSAACSSHMGPDIEPTPAPTPTPQTIQLLSVTRILAFGDSLTEGATGEVVLPPVDPATPGYTHSYPYKLQQLLNAAYPTQTIAVFNGGQGGTFAADSISRLQGLITQFSPQVTIMLDGVNDLNNGASVSAVAGSMGNLVDTAQARGVFVFLSALTRQRADGRRAGSVAAVVPYNAALGQLATSRGVPFVDIYPLVTEDLIQPDGLHLTENANSAMAAAYFAVLRARFEYTAPK
jgi:lysophospholipase L1-like esterase